MNINYLCIFMLYIFLGILHTHTHTRYFVNWFYCLVEESIFHYRRALIVLGVVCSDNDVNQTHKCHLQARY